jgi:hypothetical protein
VTSYRTDVPKTFHYFLIPMLRREFAFGDLSDADLLVDAVYRSGTSANAGADPLAQLLPVGNQGGFRTAGGRGLPGCRLAVVFSNLAEPNWPDALDVETGRFTYYGDNRRPGHQLHGTPRGGNALLRASFDLLHADPPRRNAIPPFLIFTGTGEGRDVRFRGLAVPGFSGVSATDDLIAVWKTSGTERFQNYRALFTILDVAVVPRAWIRDVLGSQPASERAPAPFTTWIREGRYRALEAERSVQWRTKQEQLPSSDAGLEIVRAIHRHFSPKPSDFEKCAALLARWMAPNITSIDLTRPWMDGGRDAVGHYRIGTDADAIKVEFALEAKCFELENGVGVKATSRLISRLRFRQFGIFVTTSFLDHQAYEEIRQDGHPVIVMSSGDIVRLLAEKGLATAETVRVWLNREFRIESPPADATVSSTTV